jgi:hypothetical protein
LRAISQEIRELEFHISLKLRHDQIFAVVDASWATDGATCLAAP